MTKFDEAVRRALSPDDARTYDDLSRDPSILRQALQTFQSSSRFVGVVGGVGGLLLFAAGSFFAWRFIRAGDLREMLLWGAAAALAFSGLGMVKMWFWMEMQKNSIVREVKRLELQVASLMMQPRP